MIRRLVCAGPAATLGSRDSFFNKSTFFWLALLLFFCHYRPSPAQAADNLFNSGTAIKQELSRVSEQGKLFVQAPVGPYLLQTAAVAAAFAVTYVFDEDISADLRGARNGTLNALTDVGSGLGDPLLHVGIAAALYTSGVVAESPRLTQLGEEVGEALVLADGATLVLQEAIGRRRPQNGDGHSTSYRPFQFKKDYDSLPSMHTASSFALAHVLASKSDNLAVKVACYAGAGLVGFSRIYQGKHWASDVVLGAALGELAGNSVTRYYALDKRGLTLAPVSIGGTPSLALIGKFY